MSCASTILGSRSVGGRPFAAKPLGARVPGSRALGSRGIGIAAVTLALVALFGCGAAEDSRGSTEMSGSDSTRNVDALYTCGMHPNVLQHEPGTCPICGMDLTPVASSGARPKAASGEKRVAYWVAPMDPTFISDKPGKSPMGMDLVPVYEDETPSADSLVVSVDPSVVQSMGVRTQRIEKQTVFRHVRTIGEVEVGEDRLSVVNLRFSGWAEKVYVDRTGDPVEAGQSLFDIYSPELVSAQEEYLLALRGQGKKSELARSARRKLELWGLADSELDKLERQGKVQRTLPIRAPQAGFVMHKNVLEGARVPSGMDLYRIGDLSRIWVTAEVYEFDAPWVEVGQPAQMELAYEEGRVLEGRVSYIYPTLNEMSRTLRVRLEFDNPDLRLRPGMFATVYIQYKRVDDVIAVPTEAILDSGRRKLVFVEVDEGRFEPREVVLGITGDRRLTEVRSGLREGERVVLSGQFLLDSESQLQEAIRKMLRHTQQSGSAPSSDAARAVTPELYACPMHADQMASEPGRCPVCGMDLERIPTTPENLARFHEGHAHAQPPQTPMPASMQMDPGSGEGPMSEALPFESGSEAGGLYVCPMHPEQQSDAPGRCAVCGMFLERAEEKSK